MIRKTGTLLLAVFFMMTPLAVSSAYDCYHGLPEASTELCHGLSVTDAQTAHENSCQNACACLHANFFGETATATAWTFGFTKEPVRLAGLLEPFDRLDAPLTPPPQIA